MRNRTKDAWFECTSPDKPGELGVLRTGLVWGSVIPRDATQRRWHRRHLHRHAVPITNLYPWNAGSLSFEGWR